MDIVHYWKKIVKYNSQIVQKERKKNVCNLWIRVHSHLWTSSVTEKKKSNIIVK